MGPQSRRHYDHRIRQAIVATGNPRLFPQLAIPRSTARAWIRRGSRRVVSTSDGHGDVSALHAELARLRAKADLYFVLASILLVVLRRLDLRLELERLPNGDAKADLLRAIELGARRVPLSRILNILGLSRSRLYAWKGRSTRCELDDRPSCPKTRPRRLTPDEVQRIKTYVLDPEYRHMGIRALSLVAQRRGDVFASATTWRTLVAERQWRRPRTRVYPAKPKRGVRATEPNEWWHLDLTVIRLLDDTKLYLHAVIDNFSRKILAWRLEERVSGGTTRTILKTAGHFLDGRDVNLMTDSGTENVNEVVDEFLRESPIRRVLAQVEVRQSNSMIEAFWRSLRHQWLYLHRLDSPETLRRLVGFYVEQHNAAMPHSAFEGQTPDEMYFGRPSVVEKLRSASEAARSARLEANRSSSCSACAGTVVIKPRYEMAREPLGARMHRAS